MSEHRTRSIRPFIGAKDFGESQAFYNDLGFTELVIGPTMSFFKVNEDIGFYLQRYYVKDWVDNSMLFLEMDDLEGFRSELLAKGLTASYPLVRISDVRTEHWGRVFFLHDPSGILWQIGCFNQA